MPDFYYQGSRYTERPLRAYVAAVGQVALAWNDLHEHLGRFFAYFTRGEDRRTGFAIWQANRVDRAKRQMMMAAVLAAPMEVTNRRPRLQDDLKWLLDRVESLEDARNDAVHAPLTMMVSGADLSPMVRGKGDLLKVATVSALIAGGNARASKVSNRDLLREYRWCRNSLILLRDFIASIDLAMNPTQPWPERPTMPTRPAPRPIQSSGRAT